LPLTSISQAIEAIEYGQQCADSQTVVMVWWCCCIIPIILVGACVHNVPS